MASERTDPFYVGYLPLPRAHRRFLMVALPLTLIAMLGSAAVLALRPIPWGDAVWETGEPQRFVGTLALEPYPMLHVEADMGTTSYLLVELGKLGTRDRFLPGENRPAPAAGQPVALYGRELRRDGRRMIELDDAGGPNGDAVVTLSDDDAPIPADLTDPPTGASVIIPGEIMDAKCFLGAMKPGRGRGHKACATLCITGGIPPVLVTRGDDGQPVYLLLTNTRGQGLRGDAIERIAPLIGEPVRVTGTRGRAGGWRTLAIDPTTGVEPI